MKKVLKKELPPHVFSVFSVLSAFLIVYLLTAIYPISVFGVQDNDPSATELLSQSGIQELPFFELPGTTEGQLIEILNEQIQALPLQGSVKNQLFNLTSTIETQFNNQENQIVQLIEQIENLQNNPNSQKAIDALQKRIDDLEQKRAEAKTALTDAVIIFQEHTEKSQISSKELVSLTRTLIKVLQELR